MLSTSPATPAGMPSVRPCFFIVNPESAGGATGRRWPRMQTWLEQLGLRYEHRLTSRRGEAATIAREARNAGFARIVCVGGDGTFNEVVNGLADEDGRIGDDIALGLVPSGTGLDLARNLGLPTSSRAAIERLGLARERLVDVGVAEFDRDRRLFLNSAGAGLDAEVAAKSYRWRRRFPGTIPYVLGLLEVLPRFQPRTFHLRLQEAGGSEPREFRTEAVVVVVANGHSLAGGMRVAPSATLDDGLLDVVVIARMPVLELLANFPKVYLGSHLSHPKVHTFRVQKVYVSADDTVWVQADGERAGLLPAAFRVVPRGLRVLV